MYIDFSVNTINQVLGSFHNRKAKARSASGSGTQRRQVCLALCQEKNPCHLEFISSCWAGEASLAHGNAPQTDMK